MATEAQIITNRRNAQKSTGPRTNRLSSLIYQRIMTSIMQNKPNLPDAQMNVTSSITKHYENARLRGREKNKPNQTQLQTLRLSKLFLFFTFLCPSYNLAMQSWVTYEYTVTPGTHTFKWNAKNTTWMSASESMRLDNIKLFSSPN